MTAATSPAPSPAASDGAAATPVGTSASDPARLGGADAATLRARGSLKWTAVDADVAAWVAESDLGTAPEVAAALHDAVDAGMLGYLPPGLRREMAEACSAWHADRYGWHVPAERIHPVADVLEALHVTIDHYSRPGSPVIVPTPAYMPFLTAPRAWGREVLEVPMHRDADGRYDLDLAALDTAFERGGHLLVLTNPHNPTGRVLDRVELLAVCEVVDRRGGRVFSDEIHAPLTLPGARHVPYASVSPTAAGHTVTATSASKAWNVPGLKCAQILLTSDADADVWAPVDVWATHGASTLGAVAAVAAYRHGGAWLDRLVAYLDGNRRAFAATLADADPPIGHHPPEGTYLAWLDLRDVVARERTAPTGHGSGPAGNLAQHVLAATGVSVVDGKDCGRAGRGFVRVNLALPRPLVVEAGRRIATRLGRGPASA